MDPERVRAYLQVACAGLGFDIGEIWWTSNENGASSVATIEEPHNTSDPNKPRKLRFVQLYTSKSFENRRSELVNPEDDTGEEESAIVPSSTHHHTALKKKHKLSPSLVDAIAKTTQVVWATSGTQEGLAGSSGIRLLTAVGMPVAVDNHGNMCCVVMFSPNNIASTDDAMEYLQNISQCATSSSIPCLLPVVAGNMQMPHPSSLVSVEAKKTMTAFHASWGDGVAVQFAPLEGNNRTQEMNEAPKDTFGIPMLPDFTDGEVFDEASYGVWTTIMEQAVTDEDVAALGLDGDIMPTSQAATQPPVVISQARKTRLEEFLYAFLGLSNFDLADVWVYSNESGALEQFTSVTETDALWQFQSKSATSLIQPWDGAVGRAYASGDPVWTSDPTEFRDINRESIFESSRIKSVLAVPVYSPTSTVPTCVVACYALVPSRSVAFVLRFVQQALRLLWSGLDTVEPHDAVGKSLWQDVTPVCLGEMAADVEMQHHFMSKKRPHSLMTTEEVRYTQPPPTLEEVQNHLVEAVQSVFDAVLYKDTSHPPKRRGGVGTPLVMPRPLPCAVVRAADPTPPTVIPCVPIVPLQPPQATENSNPILTKQQQQPNNTVDLSTAFAAQLAAQSPPVPSPLTTIDPIAFLYSIQQEQQKSVQEQQQYQATTTSTFPDNTFSCVQINETNAPARARETNRTTAPTPATTQDIPSPMDLQYPLVRRCKIQGCDEYSAHRRPYCMKHSGNRLCEKSGCKKCAQGSTRFCIAHGGGRRCTFPGCDKGARDKYFCAAHGGGKRCRHDGCTKSAVGGSDRCTAHGGGRRCSIEGCTKSAQSSTNFCVKHGGGKKCAQEDCFKVARGRTLYCASHGGGVRCRLEGCNRVAIGKQQLCRAHGGFSSRAPGMDGG